VASILGQSACYDWVPIKTTEAEKLSGSTAGSNAPDVVAVQRPDGRTVRLEGSYKLRVALRDGEVRTFPNPVIVDDAEGQLRFSGGNMAPLTTRREDIGSLKARQFDLGKTIALAVVLSLVGVGGYFALGALVASTAGQPK
jgi:hypothetical protein